MSSPLSRVQALGVPVLLTMAVTTPAPLLEAYTITVPLASATAKLRGPWTVSGVYRDMLKPTRSSFFSIVPSLHLESRTSTFHKDSGGPKLGMPYWTLRNCVRAYLRVARLMIEGDQVAVHMTMQQTIQRAGQFRGPATSLLL